MRPGPDPLFRCRLAVLAAGVLWSTGGVFIKLLTSLPGWEVSAMGITAYRSLAAALLLALPALRRAPPTARDLLPSVVLYTLLLGLYVASTQGTSAANAIFLQYTAPLYALALGPWLFREPFHRADLGAMAGAMAGIAILFAGNFQGGERLPLALGVGSGLMFGLFLLWLRRLRKTDPVALTAWNNGGVAVLALGFLAVTASPDLHLPVAAVGNGSARLALLLLFAMGAVQIAVPYVLFSLGLRRVPAVEASLIALVEPVLNPVWVLFAVGEAPTPATLVGGAVIVLTLALRYTLFRPTNPTSEAD